MKNRDENDKIRRGHRRPPAAPPGLEYKNYFFLLAFFLVAFFFAFFLAAIIVHPLSACRDL
jgi:hypothetical protein